MRDDKWIDAFDEKIDKMLMEHDIKMVIRLPKDSMDPEIRSPFEDLDAGGKNVMEFYILLHALSQTIKDLIDEQVIDPDKTEDMVDAMLEMVKADVIGGDD